MESNHGIESTEKWLKSNGSEEISKQDKSAQVGNVSVSHGQFLMPKAIYGFCCCFVVGRESRQFGKKGSCECPHHTQNILPFSSLARMCQARITPGTSLKAS